MASAYHEIFFKPKGIYYRSFHVLQNVCNVLIQYLAVPIISYIAFHEPLKKG